jgi:hypothetical protein
VSRILDYVRVLTRERKARGPVTEVKDMQSEVGGIRPRTKAVSSWKRQREGLSPRASLQKLHILHVTHSEF